MEVPVVVCGRSRSNRTARTGARPAHIATVAKAMLFHYRNLLCMGLFFSFFVRDAGIIVSPDGADARHQAQDDSNGHFIE
jgi:hypothetical protein